MGRDARQFTTSPGIASHNLYIENRAAPGADTIKSVATVFALPTPARSATIRPPAGGRTRSRVLTIEKGALAQPVTDVSLASDTLSMLKGVKRVGNDLRFDGGVSAPHLLIEEMALSGT